ncbi:MAG: helix-turn-helix domain-containing protein [Clostridia bacterium]|nr:helix-turn-helix domain-containing protein [Clostridia bacterium]
MEMAKRVSADRVADLERRVKILEARTRNALWSAEPSLTGREEALVERYGESVDKTMASKMLGVTRATVYAMLADGRIRGACEGRRVDVRSIARYLARTSQRNKVS